MTPSLRLLRPTWLAAAAALSVLAGGSALADTSVLTSDGTLYEVAVKPYGDVIPGASVTGRAAFSDFPVVALRTTSPDGKVTYDVVEGTFNSDPKGLPVVEVDETSGTLLVCYSKYQGLMSDLHVAVRRDGRWVGRDIQPNAGLYLSINPQLTASRQRYVDYDGKGGTIVKSRTIFSLVWWEESGVSQARYAPIFVEDGLLSVDNVVAYNLNDILGMKGATHLNGLPFYSFMFPAVQRDPASQNGGVLVSFASLVTHREYVVSITFPEDMTTGSGTGASAGGSDAQVRAHIPVGRTMSDRPIPESRDTQSDVGYFLASNGLATSWWVEGVSLKYLRNDAPEGDAPKSLALRPDFSIHQALAVVREMTLKN